MKSITKGQEKLTDQRWKGYRIGITGANGTLGRALTKKLRDKGAYVIGLTHRKIPPQQTSKKGPQEWINWKCGEENLLDKILTTLDILVLNHGINPKGEQSPLALNEALEINALSSMRLMNQFEALSIKGNTTSKSCEIWVNTSEAEIQPALSPGYEISKKLIGQLVSLRWSNVNKEQKKIKIRKLVLGPFFSELNPIGIMSADFVASQILNQVEFGFNLIIVSPNPLTYFLIPLNEICRSIYSILTSKIYTSKTHD